MSWTYGRLVSRVLGCCAALLVVFALAACGDRDLDGPVMARSLETGELKTFPNKGDVPPDYWLCPDADCELPPTLPCDKLGTQACELHSGCRLNLLWCEGDTPPDQTQGPDGTTPIAPKCTYSCIPKTPLLCEELRDETSCAARPDCEWGQQVCPMIGCADPNDPACGCPPEACMKKAPPQCGDHKDKTSCEGRKDCEWLQPQCLAPPCNGFCGPKQVQCPPIAPPPPGYCSSGTISHKYDAQGCVVGFDCDQPTCPKVAPPPPGFCSNGTIEVKYDAKGCVAGYNCIPNVCPPIAPPPPGYCRDGTIVWRYDAKGCTVGFSCDQTQTCSSIAAAYRKTVEAAKECNPFIMTAVKQCTENVQNALYCGCPVFVNVFAAAELNKLKTLEAAFLAKGCDKQPFICPPFACNVPVSASCQYDNAKQKGYCTPDGPVPPPTPFP